MSFFKSIFKVLACTILVTNRKIKKIVKPIRNALYPPLTPTNAKLNDLEPPSPGIESAFSRNPLLPRTLTNDGFFLLIWNKRKTQVADACTRRGRTKISCAVQRGWRVATRASPKSARWLSRAQGPMGAACNYRSANADSRRNEGLWAVYVFVCVWLAATLSIERSVVDEQAQELRGLEMIGWIGKWWFLWFGLYIYIYSLRFLFGMNFLI